MNNKISIIIPVYNEEEILLDCVKRLNTLFPDTEIIISDGGSTDNTLEYIADYATIVDARKSRSIQMNKGAEFATGNVLWFLHADCTPSHKSLKLIDQTMSDEEILGGGFRWGLHGMKWYYSIVTSIAHTKNRSRKNLFGDMGIFVRADVFKELKGYKEIPFLEDMEFNDRLKTLGKTVILDEVLYSSDRRLLEKGPIFSFIKNSFIKTLYRLGFSPYTLTKLYNTKRKTE